MFAHLDLPYLSNESLHVGCIFFAHEEGKVDKPQRFVGILEENDGCRFFVHADDLGEKTGSCLFFPGRGHLDDTRQMQLIFFHKEFIAQKKLYT